MQELLKNRRVYTIKVKNRKPYRWVICDIPRERALIMIQERFKSIFYILENGVTIFSNVQPRFINTNVVKVIDTKTGEGYPSQAEAARQLGIHITTIGKHVNRKVPYPRFKRA